MRFPSLRFTSLLFIILGMCSFIVGAMNRYHVFNMKNDSITFVHITQTSLLFAIAFGVLALKNAE